MRKKLVNTIFDGMFDSFLNLLAVWNILYYCKKEKTLLSTNIKKTYYRTNNFYIFKETVDSTAYYSEY